MMQQMGGAGRMRKKAQKKNNKGNKKGGRVTAKGPATVNKAAFALPSLEEMKSNLPGGAGLPDGFPGNG
jgi:hypothetical protein